MSMASALIWVILGLLIVLYFLPTFTAYRRGHHNATAIFVLNLFLGWTCLGWIFALVWAFTAVRETGYTSKPSADRSSVVRY